MPHYVAKITDAHIEAFVADLLDRFAPATASIRYRSIHSFFVYLEHIGEIEISPMRKLKAPKGPERAVPVLTNKELKTLLKSYQETGFEARRDTAILRLLSKLALASRR